MLSLLLLLTTATAQDRQGLRTGLREIGGGEPIHAVSEDGETTELLAALATNSPGLKLADGASCRVTVLEGSKENWLLRGTGCATEVTVTGLPHHPPPYTVRQQVRWHARRSGVVLGGVTANFVAFAITGVAFANDDFGLFYAGVAGLTAGQGTSLLLVPRIDRARAARFSLIGTPLVYALTFIALTPGLEGPQSAAVAALGFFPVFLLAPPTLSALAIRKRSVAVDQTTVHRWGQPTTFPTYARSHCGVAVAVELSEARMALDPGDDVRLDELRACAAAWSSWNPEPWRWTEDESGVALVHP